MPLHRLLAPLFLVLLATGPARASEDLRRALGQLAKAILGTIGEKSTVKVGIFALKTTGLPGVNSGQGLEQLLVSALEARNKGVVQTNAPYEVTGDYFFAKQSPDSTTKVIKIKARICDSQTGDEVQNLSLAPVVLADNKSINEILQATANLPAGENQAQRNRRIEEGARNPKVHLHGENRTRVSSKPDSPFAVEIRVKALNDPNPAVARKAEEKNGQAFVEIHQGEQYEVVAYNHSGREVAVALAIDGIDNFHFMKERKADGQPAFSYWIFTRNAETGKPREEQIIPGWFNTQKGDDTYLAFLVVGYGQGAVSRAGIQGRGNVGVIRVGFYEAYPLNEKDVPKGGDETGFGPPIRGKVTKVRYGVGAELDSVAVRYTREQK